jgi:hypothetical protein
MTTRYMSGFTNMNFTRSVSKSASYTVTTDDEHIIVTADATLTLPSIATLLPAGVGTKTYYFEVSGSGVTITLAANSADKLNGLSSTNITLTGDGATLSITSDAVQKNWELASDMPYLGSVNLQDNAVTTPKINNGAVTGAKTSLTKHYPTIVADTSGTDPVTVVTAPVAMTIKSVTAIAQDTNAGNIVVKNGTDTVATFAKSTTAGLVTGEEGALTNASVSAAAAVTVESSTTNGDGRVHVVFEATA